MEISWKLKFFKNILENERKPGKNENFGYYQYTFQHFKCN